MANTKEILDKIREFNDYLASIDVGKLKENYTRKELEQFVKDIYNVKTTSIAYEVSKLTERMKEEEFPQLLAVHHFPIIDEIDFLLEEEKIKLDEFLVRFRVGNYISGLWRITRDRKKIEKLEEWLHDQHVIRDKYLVNCPHCFDSNVSTLLTGKEKQDLDVALKRYNDERNYTDYEFITKKVDHLCLECENEPDIDDCMEFSYETLYEMMMERDTSLDNV